MFIEFQDMINLINLNELQEQTHVFKVVVLVL